MKTYFVKVAATAQIEVEVLVEVEFDHEPSDGELENAARDQVNCEEFIEDPTIAFCGTSISEHAIESIDFDDMIGFTLESDDDDDDEKEDCDDDE